MSNTLLIALGTDFNHNFRLDIFCFYDHYDQFTLVFSWCLQHPGQSLSAASMLARGAAGLALPLLVPILLTVNSEVIQQTLTTLGNQLPGRTQNPALSFTHGLGLGALVGRLIEEQYTDVGGPQVGLGLSLIL